MKKYRSQKGMLMIIALSLLFILVILTIALLQMTSFSRTFVLRCHTENKLEQTVDSVKVKILRTFNPIPGDPNPTAQVSPAPSPIPTTGTIIVQDELNPNFKVTATFASGESVVIPPPPNAGSDVKNIPKVGFSRPEDITNSTAYNSAFVPPWHTVIALHSKVDTTYAAGKTYLLALSSAFPYGVAAPNGSIELDSASSYVNPSIKEMKGISDNQVKVRGSCGLPCNVIAKDFIRIDDFDHGKAILAKKDNIEIKGNGIGFSNRTREVVTVENYIDYIVNYQILPAMDTISSGTMDKTFTIIGRPLNFMSMVHGQSFKNIASFEQALAFPIPIMPDFKGSTILWTRIAFHCPFPPDFSKGSHDTTGDEKELDSLQNKWKDVINGSKDPPKDGDDDFDQYNKDMDKIRNLSAKLHQKQGQGWDPQDAPESEEDEEHFNTTGYPYVRLMGDIFDMIASIVVDAFKGRSLSTIVSDLMDHLLVPVRLVHYGGGKPLVKFIKNNNAITTGFEWTSNWTVPRGRTLKLDCDVTIDGDLWIMDGATMYVNGDLTLTGAGFSIEDFDIKDKTKTAGRLARFLSYAPAGRIFLGRGASLIVEKDLKTFGDEWRGSVCVDSPLGHVEHMTSAILVKGDVTLPFGTVPGITLNRLAAEITDTPAVETCLNWLLDRAPLLGRIAGPFSHRTCYFASFPATFLMIHCPFPPIVTPPFPAPLPTSNSLIKPFKYLSYAYSIWLNAFLGENLFTDSSWWILGQGVVPVLPKVAGVELTLDKLGSAHWENITDAVIDTIKEELPAIIKDFLVQALITGAITVICDIVGIPVSGALGLPGDSGFSFTSKMLNLIKLEMKKFAKDVLLNCVAAATAELRSILQRAITFKFYETPGLLVYAGGKMTIGKDAHGHSTEVPLASGWFISEGDLTVDTAQTIGCLVSRNGNIKARNFYYYPYFTKASVNVPKKCKFTGGITEFFTKDLPEHLNIITPTSSQTVEIGAPWYHITSEGWDK